MQSDFFPDREQEMLSWSANFRAHLSADYASLGVTLEQAQQYAILQQAFSDELARCTPENRSKTLVAAKNDARRQMEQASRNLARVISGQEQVSELQRIALRLSIPRKSAPALPIPADAPLPMVTSVIGNTISLVLRQTNTSGTRARPRGVAGANLFYAIGDEPPVQLTEWTFHSNVSVTKATITVPGLLPNTSVWICARWYSPRGECSPASRPVRTYTTHAGPELSNSTRRAA